MKTILFFTVMIVVCLSQSQVSNDYYLSFVQTVSLNTQVSEEVDCSQAVHDALSELKAVLELEYHDADDMLDAVTSFVDKIKSEVSSMCTEQSGDFNAFLSGYSGDAKALQEVAEDNLDEQYDLIGLYLDDAFDALAEKEDKEAGKLHAEIIRILLGIDNQKIQQSQSAQVSAAAEDSSNSDDIFGGDYQEYINQLNILNTISEDDDHTVSEKSDSNSNNKDDASEGYVQGIISKLKQIKRGRSTSRQLQEDAMYFEAHSYNMDL